MSDVDSQFRKLLKQKYFSKSEQHAASESDWIDTIRPYMGNPFI